ncbi:hypothetical protein [Microbacterium ureisolvens]|uniref:Uncharacterized protein n=1 Tax=Microbacterium ureisolvens TaxID=2781186 RepID=A0ABS7HZ37_9MICO|nr:hypothetical protein [Microbacterium ureisolvens]MBW9110343.1 hypothetical protein [Microbacterium ureisolvens]
MREPAPTSVRTGEFGRIDISDVPVPAHVRTGTATYTPSGRVFLLYRHDDDPHGEDYYRAAVVDDDGDGFREIFAGRIPQSPTANGIRHMPFVDNRRVLLGDHVLEATPDLDSCENADLVGVEYPWGLAADPRVSHHWSEIIVSPDERIAWTTLRKDFTAFAALGRLRRTEKGYVIDGPTVISSAETFVPDPARAGFSRVRPTLGGEVKQFVRGGTAISSVGDGGRVLTDSVIQDLTEELVVPVTRAPGYDETTILSPDEQLGIVMSTRASATTDLAVLGLVPRPYANLIGRELAWAAYIYAVGGVREFRPGNVGPVLVDIERSSTDPSYLGVPLISDDDDWVYCSPMSWHPDGTKVMWMEMVRGSGRGGDPTMRIRVAHLVDRPPSDPVPAAAEVPAVPYGVTGTDAERWLATDSRDVRSARIAGRHSGYVEYEREPAAHPEVASRAELHFVDFSDDGRSVCTGWERVTSSPVDGTVYEADLLVRGDVGGEMKLRLEWSGLADGARIRFEPDESGRPRSSGHARCGDRLIRVEDLTA